MPSFAIIAEGVTDQAVLENILLGYFGDAEDEPVVRYVQPPRVAAVKGRDPGQGGWTLVLRSLREGDHRKALQLNDYVVVHLDTDVCEEPGYGVSRRAGDGRVLGRRSWSSRSGSGCWRRWAARSATSTAPNRVRDRRRFNRVLVAAAPLRRRAGEEGKDHRLPGSGGLEAATFEASCAVDGGRWQEPGELRRGLTGLPQASHAAGAPWREREPRPLREEPRCARRRLCREPAGSSRKDDD